MTSTTDGAKLNDAERRAWAAIVLGVEADAEREAIAARWRQVAMVVHPDGGGSIESYQRMKAAADVLLSPAVSEVPPMLDPADEPRAPAQWVRQVVNVRLVVYAGILAAAVLASALLAGLPVFLWPVVTAVVVALVLRAAWGCLGRPMNLGELRSSRTRERVVAPSGAGVSGRPDEPEPARGGG